MKAKKEKFAIGFIVAVFAWIQMVCVTLERKGNMEWNIRNTFICLGISALCVILFFLAVFFLQRIKKQFCDLLHKYDENTESRMKISNKWMFFVSWMFIFACWIPVLLAYYPGILAYDSYVQIEQIMNGAYNNHHPLIHTLMIALFIKIGGLTGNVNLGVAMYTVVQMLCLAAVMSAGVYLLAKKGVRRIWLWIVILYCGLCPSNSYMAVSMTKDVFFTIFVLLFLFILVYLLEGKEHHFMWDVTYMVVATLMMLFRNNGKYAMLVFLGISLLLLFTDIISCRKKKENVWPKRKGIVLILGETVVSLLVSTLLLSGLNYVVSSQEGDKREMLSIPIQQVARCMVYHGGLNMVETDDNTISESDKSVINEFILYNGYTQYNPIISDPVKRCTNTSVILNKTKEFVNMYVGLAVDYPAEYVNAFLAVNGGYLSVWDESHSKVNLYEDVRGLGYLQTRWEESVINQAGIYKDSKWMALYTKLDEFASENGYLKIPVVKNLIAPGMYIWGYIALGIWAFFKREKKYQLPLFYVAGYYVTLLLGPTVQLRYLYPVMLFLPFVYLYILYSNRSKT